MSSSTDLRLSVTSHLDSIEEEWRRFEERADCTPFQTFDWLATWQRCIGGRAGVKPAIVTGRRRDGELLFIVPLAIEGKWFNRRLVFLGRELGDYNAPLLAPEFPDLVPQAAGVGWWRSVRQLLENRREYWHDVVFLDKMPEHVGSQPNPLLCVPTSPHPSSAHVTRLGESWESFYAARRSPATRRRDRGKRKKLEESGMLRFVTADEPTGRTAALAILIQQKSRAFARMGVPDLFARPGHAEFFNALANEARRLIHISRLEIGSTCAATNLGLMFRDRYYHVLASYDDGPLARFGPGMAHLHQLMSYAIAQGCRYFDFTIGDEAYKLDWADTQLRLYDHIEAASWSGEVAATRIMLALCAKRCVKRTPVLFALAQRLRSMLGTIKAANRRQARPD